MATRSLAEVPECAESADECRLRSLEVCRITPTSLLAGIFPNRLHRTPGVSTETGSKAVFIHFQFILAPFNTCFVSKPLSKTLLSIAKQCRSLYFCSKNYVGTCKEASGTTPSQPSAAGSPIASTASASDTAPCMASGGRWIHEYVPHHQDRK